MPEEAAKAAAKPGLSGKAVIGWGVGMLLFLALAGTCAYLYASVNRTTEVLNLIYDNQPSTMPGPEDISRDEAVRRLGGEERAASRLAFYLRVPDRLAPEKRRAIQVLSFCDDSGTDVLLEALDSRNPDVRSDAASMLTMVLWGSDWARPEIALAIIERREDEAVFYCAEQLLTKRVNNSRAASVRIEALNSPDLLTRRWAASGLGRVGTSSDAVIPALEKALADEDQEVRARAHRSLKAIRGEE